MKKFSRGVLEMLVFLGILAVVIWAGSIVGTSYAQSISIEPLVTIKVVGVAPISGLAGLQIQAVAPEGVRVDCLLQNRIVEECIHPSVARYAFVDEENLIQSSDPIDALGIFQFTGPSGSHDVIFNVLTADDDSGNPIIFEKIVTQISLP